MRVLFLLFISFVAIFADVNKTENNLDQNLTNLNLTQTKEANITKNIIENLQKDLKNINETIKDNIWLTQYQNHLSYPLKALLFHIHFFLFAFFFLLYLMFLLPVKEFLL